MIVYAAAEAFDVVALNVQAACRGLRETRARYAACLLAEQFTQQSRPQIGHLVGCRDRGGVRRAIIKASQLWETDEDFRVRFEGAKNAVLSVAKTELAERLRDVDTTKIAEAVCERPNRNVSSWELIALASRVLSLEELAGDAFQLLADVDRLADLPRDAATDELRGEIRSRIAAITETLAELGYRDAQPQQGVPNV
ncbi:hypothetical protein DY467_09125 [Rhodopseudomonas sp. BR0G17]|nr:hypothetical protein [Rhodopseudomonas sp. BR0G17]